MSDINNHDPIDLGSDPVEDEFDPFAGEDELDDGADDTTVDTPAQQPAKTTAQTPTPKQTTTTASGDDSNDSDNPLATAIGNAETKDAEKSRQSLQEKPPVFNYANATENIEDASQTFDELRIAKAADFPELEDGKRVKWEVEYCNITKVVADPKGMSIAKMKSDIEASKEFTTALKKSKDKNPVCKVKPRVTAQSKGVVSASAYKGVFANMEDAEEAGKVISILPAKDGKVYEMRKSPMGRFITPIVGCEMLSDVKAGFTPALGIPRIPVDMTMRIITFFRYFTLQGGDNEVLVNIYWDIESEAFIADVPEQLVSKVSIHSNGTPKYADEQRYIHFMDLHSHNSMKAFFSPTDDKDEKATRLYTVIGRLDKYMPEIKTRISNGGKFHEIDPSEVFEYIARPFPDEWREKVSLGTPHKDIDDSGTDCAKGADKSYFLRDNDCGCSCNCGEGDTL